jgi:hypothetical protein
MLNFVLSPKVVDLVGSAALATIVVCLCAILAGDWAAGALCHD